MAAKTNRKGAFLVPCLIIAVGVGWLLTTQGVVPGVNWVWSLGLAVVGIVVLAAGGINKFSIVVGPFFLIATLLSVIRQTGGMSIDAEVPVLVIVVGILMLIAQLPAIPPPAWMIEGTGKGADEAKKSAKL